jgi:hypothetical protein
MSGFTALHHANVLLPKQYTVRQADIAQGEKVGRSNLGWASCGRATSHLLENRGELIGFRDVLA